VSTESDSESAIPGKEFFLPTKRQVWPRKDGSLKEIPADQDDFPHDQVTKYTQSQKWQWSGQRVFFFCDLHADADAFLLSLVASGGVVRTGKGDGDFKLTTMAKEALFIVGGDCFDKGPSTLRLLDVIYQLKQKGAKLILLAGNHDVRTYLGVFYAETKEPLFDHLFVRLGKKSAPLLKEIYQRFVSTAEAPNKVNGPNSAVAKAILYPDENWAAKFPGVAKDWMNRPKLAKEIRRVKEKSIQFEQELDELDLSFSQAFLAIEKFKQLFLQPGGKYFWFYDSMELVHREGSYLFLHAGLDDALADQISKGIAGVNREFRQALIDDPFSLYHGIIGNAFRTKYRGPDDDFTSAGADDLHEAGIHAVVHGHRNNGYGQRVLLRRGMMNFECDTTLDRNTRLQEGLTGIGTAVVIFEPDGTVQGISRDYPYIKVFNPGYSGGAR